MSENIERKCKAKGVKLTDQRKIIAKVLSESKENLKMSDIRKFTCNICTRKFSRKYNLKIHIRSKHDHSDLNFSCYLCRKNFKNQATYLDHIDQHKEGLSFVLYKKAFDKTIIIYRKKLKDYFDHTFLVNKDDPLLKYWKELNDLKALDLRIMENVGMENTAKLIWSWANDYLIQKDKGRSCCWKTESKENKSNRACFQQYPDWYIK